MWVGFINAGGKYRVKSFLYAEVGCMESHLRPCAWGLKIGRPNARRRAEEVIHLLRNESGLACKFGIISQKGKSQAGGIQQGETKMGMLSSFQRSWL
jgi:hypothetical protein